MFKPAAEVSEHGTGAVRSTDLAIERWDLISWPSVEQLTFSMVTINPTVRVDSIKTNVAWAVHYIGEFLAGQPLANLTDGWAYLAFAIQKRDMPEVEFDKWASSFESGSFPNEAMPFYALTRLATTCHEGAVKYGEHNWLYGFQVSGLCNHLLRHLIMWLNGDRSEDHLGHSMWGFMAAVHMTVFRPDMRKGIVGPGFVLTDEIKETLSEHAAHRTKLRPEDNGREDKFTRLAEKLQTGIFCDPDFTPVNPDVPIEGEIEDIPERCVYDRQMHYVSLKINGSSTPLLCPGYIAENGDLVIKDFSHSVRTK